MDLDAIAFPALIVADDGWVDYVDAAARLVTWTTSAISKYNKRRVVLCDHRDRAWLVERILPRERRSALVRLALATCNAKIAVQIQVRPITESPVNAVRDYLLVAIDADDDVLTQHTDSQSLKAAVQKAASFEGIVQVLRASRAIDR